MKLSKPLSVLILIASALLLNAARNANGEPRSKQHTSKVETTSNRDESDGSPVATPINQSAAEKGNSHSGGETYNYSGAFNYTPPASPAESNWAIAGEIASVASAVLVAIFTALLWYVSRQQKLLMVKTEETSRRSVDLMDRDVLSDRPFVTVAAVDRDRSYREYRDFRPCAQFQNSGNSPAVILKIAFGFNNKPFDLSSREPLIPHIPAPDYSSLSSLPLSKHVLASRETMTVNYGLAYFSEAEWKDILAAETRIAVFGKIYYRDAAANEPPYEQPFYWFFSPPGQITPEGFFYLGPDELNRGT